jgi:hypothetical protein
MKRNHSLAATIWNVELKKMAARREGATVQRRPAGWTVEDRRGRIIAGPFAYDYDAKGWLGKS